MKPTRVLAYAAFFLFSFIIGIYLTFPWDMAKDRVLELATKQAGTRIWAAKLEPSWFTGVEAEGLEIGAKNDAIKIERIRARVGLLALITGKQAFSAWMPLGGGDVDAKVKLSEDVVDLEAHLKGVQLDKAPIVLEQSGLPLMGKVDLDLDLKLGKKDPKATAGKLSLRTTGLSIDKGGKMGMIPVPNLELGDLKLEVPIADGKADFKNVRLPGTDLEVAVDGNMVILWPLARTTLNMTLGLKPTEKLLGSDPLLRPILKNFEYAKDAEGFYGVGLTGSIQHPRPTPRRR
ncbi:MAG: type II secretion system protein GspN [Myxococcota bacterium]